MDLVMRVGIDMEQLYISKIRSVIVTDTGCQKLVKNLRTTELENLVDTVENFIKKGVCEITNYLYLLLTQSLTILIVHLTLDSRR